MGLGHSKKRRVRVNSANRNDHILQDLDSNDVRVVSLNAFDQEEIKKLKKELRETPQLFILNNLLLSVMFFENYEKEKQKLIHTSATHMEKTLNPILMKNETIEVVMPDIIFEKVNKNCAFRPVHGPNKFSSEPLVPKRFYVVNDNIEVIESLDELQYSAIDKPSYKVHVEESTRNGFVKLRNLEARSKKESPQSSTEDIKIQQAGPSSAPDDSDSTYDYTTITDVKTPKPLNIMDCQRRDTLPKTCFAVRKIRKYDEISDSEDEEPKEQNEEDLFETISYISSKGFMHHFQNAVFPSSLGQTLGFDKHEISLAQAIPGTIFCNLVDDDSDTIPCEIYPSVAIQWPSMQTYEFPIRAERPTMIYKNGDRYRWPTDQMIKEMFLLKCALIPRGYFLKRGENIDSEIEWEIEFPRAERYLDTRMSHAQIKIFLFFLLLFKTYIEPGTKQHGLLADHIRHHLYWECEVNPRDWPELRLGSKIIKSMERLNEKLSKNVLPNYFIKSKNSFENIPKKYLKHAQKMFHHILESPVIYFMGALRNLRYKNGKFYPPINFSKLYNILTTKQAIKTINNTIMDENYQPPNLQQKKRRAQNMNDDLNHMKEVNWRIKKERLNRQKVLKQRQEQKEREENLKLQEQRKISKDSIDFEWECEKSFDIVKTHQILDFFIKHFIEVAKKSRKISTERQTLLYLKQAYYLAKIMEESPHYSREAKQHLEIIAKEEDISKRAVSENFDSMPPTTPSRNSAQFNWELTQQVKSNNIKLNNLNKTFTSQNVVRANSNLRPKSGVLKKSLSELSVKKNVEFSNI